MQPWRAVVVLSSFALGCDEAQPPNTPDRVAAALPAATPEAVAPAATTPREPVSAPMPSAQTQTPTPTPTPTPNPTPASTSSGTLEQSPPSSGCACPSDAGGFDLAIACGAESCVDHQLLRCDASEHLSRAGSCGGPACGCTIEDASSSSTLELGCGLRVCLNGGVVECSATGQITRGGACKN